MTTTCMGPKGVYFEAVAYSYSLSKPPRKPICPRNTHRNLFDSLDWIRPASSAPGRFFVKQKTQENPCNARSLEHPQPYDAVLHHSWFRCRPLSAPRHGAGILYSVLTWAALVSFS
jgi:hypothetical protein